jgi:hypothetical protein
MRKIDNLPAPAASAKMQKYLLAFLLRERLLRERVEALRVGVEIELGIWIHNAPFSWNVSD